MNSEILLETLIFIIRFNLSRNKCKFTKECKFKKDKAFVKI